MNLRGQPVATTHPGSGIREIYSADDTGALIHNWAQPTGPWAGWDAP